MKSVAEITPAVERKLAAMGLELYEMKFIPAGRKSALRIYVDKQSGVTIEDCERASKEISVLLDVEEFSSNPYSLEVSSPGLDRPLTTERDFHRVKGKMVAIEAARPAGQQTRFEGVVHECGSGEVRITAEGKEIVIALSDIRSARVQLQF